MLIYNVTVKVNWAMHNEWLLWMQHEHMKDVVATGCFTRSQLLRLLEIDETDGPTYATQYYTECKSDYDRYIENHSTFMRQKTFDKWEDQFVAFRSLMEIVQ